MTLSRKAATLTDVARLAGLSPMTVSRAFKADSSISAATRKVGLKAADAPELQILLCTTDCDMTKEERLIEQLLRRRPEAIVVTGGNHTPRARRLLENAGIPVIETWDLPEVPIGHVVGFSNAQAVRGMVDHFVRQGLTRIAFIRGDASRNTRGADRRAGFVAEMQAGGLDAKRTDPARIIISPVLILRQSSL